MDTTLEALALAAKEMEEATDQIDDLTSQLEDAKARVMQLENVLDDVTTERDRYKNALTEVKGTAQNLIQEIEDAQYP